MMVVVVILVIAAFFTGCLSAQAGSRFSTNPIFNFQYNPKRKVLPYFTDVDIQVQKWEVACPGTEPNGTVSDSSGCLFIAQGG